MKKIILITILLILSLTGCIQKNKTTIIDLYYEGENAYYKGNYDESLQKFNKVIELDSNFSDAYEKRSAIFLKMEKLNEAEINAKQAIKIWPNDFKSYVYLGRIYRSINHLKSFEYFKKAIEINPFDAISNFELAKLYFDTNDCNNAVKHFKVAEKYKHTSDIPKLIKEVSTEITEFCNQRLKAEKI